MPVCSRYFVLLCCYLLIRPPFYINCFLLLFCFYNLNICVDFRSDSDLFLICFITTVYDGKLRSHNFENPLKTHIFKISSSIKQCFFKRFIFIFVLFQFDGDNKGQLLHTQFLQSETSDGT